jgi:hypothetical protein
MVEALGHKLATHHPVIEPVSAAEPGTEICDAETGTQKPAYHLAEINPETRREFEKRPFRRNKCEKAGGSLSPTTGWWARIEPVTPSMSTRRCSPLSRLRLDRKIVEDQLLTQLTILS